MYGRRPLVYLAPHVLRSSEHLLPQQVVLEEAVADAIAAGRVYYGGSTRVVVKDGLVAVCRREPGRLRRRPRVWHETKLERRSEHG